MMTPRTIEVTEDVEMGCESGFFYLSVEEVQTDHIDHATATMSRLDLARLREAIEELLEEKA